MCAKKVCVRLDLAVIAAAAMLGALLMTGGQAAVALTLNTGDIVVADPSLNAVFVVDPVTGNRTILSDNSGSHGSTANPFSGVNDVAFGVNGMLYVANQGNVDPGVMIVDPTTGNRTILSDKNHGAGDNFFRADALVVESDGSILVSDLSWEAIFRVDPTTGNRTVLSGVATGTGPGLVSASGIVLQPSGTILVANRFSSPSVMQVSPSSGNRSILSDNSGSYGSTDFGTPAGVAIAANGQILVADNTFPGVFTVDPTTGIHAILSDNSGSHGSGTNFSRPWDLAVESSGTILVTDYGSGVQGIFRVDPLTGNRTLLSNAAHGSGTTFSQVSGLEVYNVPEPSTFVLFAIGAASLLGYVWRRRWRSP